MAGTDVAAVPPAWPGPGSTRSEQAQGRLKALTVHPGRIGSQNVTIPNRRTAATAVDVGTPRVLTPAVSAGLHRTKTTGYGHCGAESVADELNHGKAGEGGAAADRLEASVKAQHHDRLQQDAAHRRGDLTRMGEEPSEQVPVGLLLRGAVQGAK